MVGLFCMVRKPKNFDTWLEYQISLGIDHIFLLVEDTPELKPLVDSYQNVWAIYDNDSDKSDNYWTLIDRQKKFWNIVKERSIQIGLNWLIHSDCDELICCQKSISQLLSEVSSEFDTVHFSNYEAVYDYDDLENPFLQTNRFRYKKHLSYGNGKSAVRVCENMQWKGPHKFKGNRYEISPKEAVILHYESSTFDCWYEKFMTSSNTGGDKISDMPFEFYKESINIVKSKSKEECREFYNKMKVNTLENTLLLSWMPLMLNKNIVWTR